MSSTPPRNIISPFLIYLNDMSCLHTHTDRKHVTTFAVMIPYRRMSRNDILDGVYISGGQHLTLDRLKREVIKHSEYQSRREWGRKR